MTLNEQSRYHGAITNLPIEHRNSLVRQALAVSSLRSFATMDGITRTVLQGEKKVIDWDETMAGTIASKMKMVSGKYPDEIGSRIRQLGLIEPKYINTALLDVIYVDSDSTIEKNNELVYLLGNQLEQLFDPLSEYSPEPTERLYAPPVAEEGSNFGGLDNDSKDIQAVVEELFSLQCHFKDNLLSFLQDFLIPLRVQVLGGEIDDEDMTIRKLNTIFPPTIDEIVRINNLFFEALQQALPYGSFEVMRACGMTIPYFYKACMRHEAATRNFQKCLKPYYTLFRQHLPSSVKYTPRIIESTIQCSLHLTRVKLVLERLMQVCDWKKDDVKLVNEFYQSAVGTIDAFGREQVSTYDRRVFTPTGKVLVEIAKGWPKELEYGWINRRVVTIFDAMNVMSRNNNGDNHHIILIFTDQLVILEPTEPIPMTSTSGMHLPSVADILMHSMINEQPLQNIPELKVVAWAPIETVTMAEYNNSQNICINVPNGIKFQDTSTKYQLLYQLVRSDHDAGQFVAMLSKAQVMNKTQPFHLFKNSRSGMTVYATVHELQGYAQEVNKTPIALFMNVDVTRDVLKANNLSACFKVEFEESGGQDIRVQAFSAMGGGEFDRTVTCDEFAQVINQETAYLYSLHFSTKNKGMISSILENNRELTNHLIKYSVEETGRRKVIQPPQVQQPTYHKKHQVTIIENHPEDHEEYAQLRQEPAKRKITPLSIFSKLVSKKDQTRQTSSYCSENSVEDAPVPELTHSDSSSSSGEEVFEFPPRNNSKDTISSDDSWEDISCNTTGSSIGLTRLGNNSNIVVIQSSSTASNISTTQRSLNRPVSITQVGSIQSTDIEEREQEQEQDEDELRAQRDVEAWFSEYNTSIDELSLSEFSFDNAEQVEEEENDPEQEVEQEDAVRQLEKMFRYTPRDSIADSINTVRSSRILSQFSSPKYYINNNKVEEVEEEEDEFEFNFSDTESLSTINADDDNATLNVDEDFRHLAGFWNDSKHQRNNSSITNNTSAADSNQVASNAPSLPELPRSVTNLWPSLRDPSIMFLGSYVHSRNASVEIKEESNEPSGISSLDIEAGHSEGQWMSGALPNTLNNVLRFSSSNSLQLASFTVEIDQLIRQDEDKGWLSNAGELERVKHFIVSQYERTRNLLSTDAIPIEEEVMNRNKVMQLTWKLIIMAHGDERYRKIVDGVLQMETLRRLKLDGKVLYI